MRSSSTILLFLSVTHFCAGQKTKEEKFKATVQQIVIAFSKQDSAAISKYINEKIGLYQMDRVGVFDHYNHFTTLSFSDTTSPQLLFRLSKNIKMLPIQYAELPTWDCDKEVWSKKGLFVDTAKTDHRLSKICKYRKKYIPDNIPAKTIQFFFNIENKSRRIVLNDNNETELVFYLSYLNDRWFLTIIDNVSSDCSS
jgi:hypothetical protein